MKKVFCILSVLLSLSFGGCTVYKGGDFIAKSHFVHPGSTVKSLGHVKAEVSDWGFIMPPDFDYGKALNLFESALNQKLGSDMMINYRLDTVYTAVPTPLLGFPVYSMKVTIEGEAADMEVGKKQ